MKKVDAVHASRTELTSADLHAISGGVGPMFLGRGRRHQKAPDAEPPKPVTSSDLPPWRPKSSLGE
jgi:hypothetical protein